MAFDVSKMAGMGAGSGLAPAIFTYTTPDDIADVTANDYFNDLKGVLKQNDIIFSLLLNEGAGTLRVQVVELSDTDLGTKVPLYSVYIGDKRATDTAGYQLSNMSPNVGGSVQRIFTYRNNANTKAQIAGAGYFDESKEMQDSTES
jgi:hypothetical protein